MKLNVDRLTGVRSTTPVRIYDSEMSLFYYNEPKGGDLFFNLPTGNYFVESGDLNFCEPLKFSKIENIAPTRSLKRPERMEIYIGENPHKCSVYQEKGIILFDRNFYESLGVLGREFIYNHEMAHFDYDGSEAEEIACDVYAANQMLENGYNPSQLYSIAVFTLSLGESNPRVLALNEKLKNIQIL